MTIEKIVVPDFGDVQEITVVDVYVAAGDTVEVESPLIALESEKAVMDIPSPLAGKITEVKVAEDDTVKSGDLIAMIEVAVDSAAPPAEATDEDTAPEPAETAELAAETEPVAKAKEEQQPEPDSVVESAPLSQTDEHHHASPSVRAYARELGVELAELVGTGPKGRIRKEDVQGHVKQALKAAPAAGTAMAVAAQPLEDFSVYGEIEELQLGRIQKVSGPHLHRSWLSIPHVTHSDEADITELENFRKGLNAEAGAEGPKYSSLIFVIKALVATLREFPLFNCSLVPDGGSVIIKRYYHIGIAVDTPGGLVVPVIKDADKKGLQEIAVELQKLSGAAREGKLAIPDIQGASFTISSLGGIGGTGFTPIVNSPQVAILGLSRSAMKPVWDGEEFTPRLLLPFSVSYDHRVIDGAEAARFCRALSQKIHDLRRVLI